MWGSPTSSPNKNNSSPNKNNQNTFVIVTKENTELTISATVGHVSTPVKAGASKTGDAEDCISTPVKAPASKKKATASKKGDGEDWDSVIQRLCSQPALLFLLLFSLSLSFWHAFSGPSFANLRVFLFIVTR